MLRKSSRIKVISASILLFFTLSLAIGAYAQQQPEQLAQQASITWLALVDSGKYADSWQESSPMFKAHVSKEQWKDMLRATRDPLGKMVSRKLSSATYTKTLPGAPDGDYVVIQYETSFEHKQSATETVTPMLDKDGKWRVSGYFIK
jgi:hypothetical protein